MSEQVHISSFLKTIIWHFIQSHFIPKLNLPLFKILKYKPWSCLQSHYESFIFISGWRYFECTPWIQLFLVTLWLLCYFRLEISSNMSKQDVAKYLFLFNFDTFKYRTIVKCTEHMYLGFNCFFVCFSFICKY